MKLVQKIFLLLTILSLAHNANGQSKSKQEILTSIGKVSKWHSVNYILFSSNTQNSIFKERAFLIDKSSGKARFDGKTTNNISLVLLFNYKSKALEKGYINGKLTDAKSIIQYQEVLNQLFDDTKLLFLPMFIVSTHSSHLTIGPGKIANAEKLTEINFKNVLNLNKQAMNGTIYLNSKGDIKEYYIDQSVYAVGDIKDIGDGILLPTRFNNLSNPSLNIKFNIVAGFTDIESDKFSTL
ncbi:hypothetical protein [Sphingobacterium rhinopitheci]|uniref:hypothetical protein n=1 Tax=Sphingobacterium rhinopitheci TaxID=2781960 RepID=UPI001F52147C|nr:hypothetical protein [Sphingobacterium rhinopitheci]MCI0921050.1 hypothetical protein [Sphingobacterium rhinopitheci]